MKPFNVGIIGAGWIAQKMADAVNGLPGKRGIRDVKGYAIASRELGKAQEFAARNGFAKAYGSYRELVEDPEVDLVYIATPHSHHFAHASLALESGKPVLCEKAFTANAREAAELIELSHAKAVFITEAIWTRFMPLSLKINELINNGTIGELRQVSASLCYEMDHKERILRPELCGGALLDLGVYTLHFARMYFGSDIERTVSSCRLFPTGTDEYNNIVLYYRDGRVANLQSSALSRCDRHGLVTGTKGYIVVDNINCPEAVRVFDSNYRQTAEFRIPETQVNGYEYQLLACREAIADGQLETPFISHGETLAVMKQMDALREEWGMKYPMD